MKKHVLYLKYKKVCGVTRPEDARAACQSGASLIGVIFAPKSKRRCTGAQAKLVVDQVRSFGERTAPVAIPIPRGPSDPSLSLGAKLGLGAAALRAASARTPLVVGVFQDQTADEVRYPPSVSLPFPLAHVLSLLTQV